MNCNEYRIMEVNDDDLPPEHDWVLIDEPFAVTFVVKQSRWGAQVVAEGWAAYRQRMRQRGAPYLRAV